jgi:hypothetical protein
MATGRSDADEDGPRLTHYLFAYRYLPDQILHSPAEFLSLARRPDADERLRHAWKLTDYRASRQSTGATPLAAEGLRCEVRELPNYTIILVALPKPERFAEAYFVAGLIGPAPPRRWGVFAVEPTSHVLTLEHARPEADGSPRTVLGSWDRGGTHINMGTGPPPDPERFLAVIDEWFTTLKHG